MLYSKLLLLKLLSFPVNTFNNVNLLSLKNVRIGALFDLVLISGIFISTSIALGLFVYSYKFKSELNKNYKSILELETVNV